MSVLTYYILCGVCSAAVFCGIFMMSRVKTAVAGNLLSAAAVIGAVAITIVRYEIYSGAALYICLGAGLVAGILGAYRVKMIAMPQTVAILNGLGGAASALVAGASCINGFSGEYATFECITAGLALAVGALTLTGSLIAAGKLARIIDAKPKVLPGHGIITAAATLLCLAGVVLMALTSTGFAIAVAVIACIGGVIFVLRVGGADMPITISLLNSLSGVAGGIAGMAIGDPLLVAIGGIVGASGLILTQDMCRAMNRSLSAILTGKTTVAAGAQQTEEAADEATEEAAGGEAEIAEAIDLERVQTIIKDAKKVIIVPGYGMALSQAQHEVAAFARALGAAGAEVKFAIHPVAGRMPGHMSVLLCEADIPYEQLYMMEDINPEFASCDITIVIGANDVTNPAANTAEGTPIYGMPVLSVVDAPAVVICNFDEKPGYAGVPNPLYSSAKVLMLLGDAKESVEKLAAAVK